MPPGVVSDPIERLNEALAGRYRLKRVLGRGGMGTVYLADDLRHGRTVAVKVLRAEVSSSIALDRFRREVAIAARLTHPRVVGVMDSGEADGLLYYVMPHIDGETLAERLSREGRLSPRDALAIGRSVVDALEHAHELGIVHRDIKPSNILLTRRHAVLTDFGVARAIAAAADQRLTADGAALGTPAYMSPEQAFGGAEVDRRSDLYSLGCVLFEMLAGRPPFDAPTTRAVLMRHARGDAPDLDALAPGLPPGLSALVARAMDRSPERRPASATELLESLDAVIAGLASREGRGGFPRRATGGSRRTLAAAGVVILAVAAGLWWRGGTLEGGWRDGVGEARSLVVLPFQAPNATEAEDSLARLLADELTRQVNGWEGAVAVPSVSLAGPMFDLGLPGPHVRRMEDGVRVARELGVEMLIGLSVLSRGDSAWVTATLQDPRRRSGVGRPLVHGGPASDLFGLVAPISARVLGLEAGPAALARLQRYSRSPAAVSRYEEGRHLLDAWRLQEAEDRFREAISLDSTFAMAHHALGLTLHWQAARDRRRTATLGPEVARLTAVALRHGEDLPERERAHVEAFHRFQLGDYEAARRGYGALLGRDSTDVHAWLLLGAVEYLDPWLVAGPDGELEPRSDLNVAVRAFTNAVRFSPGFHLGYGHLFDIHSRIASTLEAGSGFGFEVPREELIAPWESVSPFSQKVFFPVALDSVVWMDAESFQRMDRARARRGTSELENQLYRLLQRWIAFAPEAVRPHEQLAAWALSQMARATPPVAPERIDSLVFVARRHAGRALALSSDTLPADLFRLADLNMASGAVAEARTLADAAFARIEEGHPDGRLGANFLMATGQVGRLMEVLAAPGDRQRYVMDTVSGELVAYGSGMSVVQRLRGLAATGVGGELASETIAELERLWGAPARSSREGVVLRQDATGFVAAAIAEDPDALARWSVGFESKDPLLDALLADDPDSDRVRHLLETAHVIPGGMVTGSSRLYLIALAAQRADAHPLALRALAGLDSVPPGVGSLDPAWGFRTLAHGLKALSHEALGAPERAEASRERFFLLMTDADGSAASQRWLAELRKDLDTRPPSSR